MKEKSTLYGWITRGIRRIHKIQNMKLTSTRGDTGEKTFKHKSNF